MGLSLLAKTPSLDGISDELYGIGSLKPININIKIVSHWNITNHSDDPLTSKNPGKFMKNPMPVEKKEMLAPENQEFLEK